MRVVACWWMVVVAGCGTATSLYPYRVVNDGCDCTQFRTTDKKVHVSYSVSGLYSLGETIRTDITLSIRNDNRDTLDLSLAYVKVSSRNVPYRYNGKFLPVTISHVAPGKERTLSLEGEANDLKGIDPWLAIAGEELTLTIEGMRMNGRQLRTQVIRFVPQNPKLQPVRLHESLSHTAR